MYAQVPEWVFQGKADHDWKSYDDVYNQDWCAFLEVMDPKCFPRKSCLSSGVLLGLFNRWGMHILNSLKNQFQSQTLRSISAIGGDIAKDGFWACLGCVRWRTIVLLDLSGLVHILYVPISVATWGQISQSSRSPRVHY